MERQQALSDAARGCRRRVCADAVQQTGHAGAIGAARCRRWLARFVVKPAIGPSAAGTRCFAEHDITQEDEQHLALLLRQGAVLVQPFVPEVETSGERSLVFFGSVFSHAYTKPAFNGDATGTATIAPYQPSAAELGV